jgi:hypothetical protein
MLEDELVHVLSRDHELKLLIVVENRDNIRFLRNLRSKNCTPRTVFLDKIPMLLKDERHPDSKMLVKFLYIFPSLKEIHEKRKLLEKKKVTVVVNLLKMGLHSDLELLKAEVYKNIRKMAPFSDNILIFYGSCGHTLVKLEEDFADLGCPLSFLKDKDRETVEDCISLAFGGNEAYIRSLAEFSGMGAFYLTPMWALSWKQMAKETGIWDFNNNCINFDKVGKAYGQLGKHFSVAVKIDTGLANDSEFHENVQEYARIFGTKIVDLKGSVEIAEQSYLAARNTVTGNNSGIN